MSGSPKNVIDSSGTYSASIISKSGRNEVQIFQLSSHSSSELIEDSKTIKLELQADETILDAVWYTTTKENSEVDLAARKRTKRRASGGEETHLESSFSTNLALLIQSGEILLLTPHSDKIVSRIPSSSETVLSGLVVGQNSTKSSLWAFSSSMFYEVATDRNQIIKTVSLSEENGIRFAHILDTTGVSISVPKLAVPVLVGAQQGYYVDLSKSSKKAKLTTFPSNQNTPATFLKQSSIDGNKVFVLRGHRVSLYNLKLNDEEVSTFDIAPSTIYNIQLVSNMDQEVLLAVTSEGVQTFNIDHDSIQTGQTPSSLIKTSYHEEAVFTNVWYNKTTHRLAGVWYNSNEPRFVEIDWKFNTVGEVQVPVEHNKPYEPITEKISSISIPKKEKMKNLEAGELSEKLTAILAEAPEEEVIGLLATNNHQAAIKETLKTLSTNNVNRVFQIVSTEVGSDPSKKSTLAVWLKWILLTHGGALGKEEAQLESLKTLQSGLNSGIKVMPHLLAIQGRLQLLKSQAQLRQSVVEEDDDDDEEDEIEKETEDTKLDEIIFANGENDEEDEVEEV